MTASALCVGGLMGHRQTRDRQTEGPVAALVPVPETVPAPGTAEEAARPVGDFAGVGVTRRRGRR